MKISIKNFGLPQLLSDASKRNNLFHFQEINLLEVECEDSTAMYFASSETKETHGESKIIIIALDGKTIEARQEGRDVLGYSYELKRGKKKELKKITDVEPGKVFCIDDSPFMAIKDPQNSKQGDCRCYDLTDHKLVYFDGDLPVEYHPEAEIIIGKLPPK